ncbi:MAG TPA: Ldh family oxidoreductase, partial [Acidobacteriaceae bacterium]|nr:Ldh family oxidoreductase [Acidobacteriaceae bacterium]
LAAICWTNTLPNLPPWGASSPVLGNNPLVIAIPRRDGAQVVLDMALSQFSYGTLAASSAEGKQLPVPGGYDLAGRLTTDPAAIEASQRALAIGYWKGSGLSLMLDMLAAMLSGGSATHQIPPQPERESGVSQVFLAFDPAKFAAPEELDRIAAGILESVRQAIPIEPARPPRYPGEHTLQLREENMRLGVPVDSAMWDSLQALSF